MNPTNSTESDLNGESGLRSFWPPLAVYVIAVSSLSFGLFLGADLLRLLNLNENLSDFLLAQPLGGTVRGVLGPYLRRVTASEPEHTSIVVGDLPSSACHHLHNSTHLKLFKYFVQTSLKESLMTVTYWLDESVPRVRVTHAERSAHKITIP